MMAPLNWNCSKKKLWTPFSFDLGPKPLCPHFSPFLPIFPYVGEVNFWQWRFLGRPKHIQTPPFPMPLYLCSFTVTKVVNVGIGLSWLTSDFHYILKTMVFLNCKHPFQMLLKIIFRGLVDLRMGNCCRWVKSDLATCTIFKATFNLGQWFKGPGYFGENWE